MIDARPSYQELKEHALELSKQHIKTLFEKDSERFAVFSTQGPHLFFDYSKNLLTQDTITLLEKLLTESGFFEKRNALFNGARVSGSELNPTENRQVLHTALRLPLDLLASDTNDTQLPSIEIRREVLACRRKMSEFVDRAHRNEIKGYTGKLIKTMVSIGIGGSFLGPKMVTEALKPFAIEGFNVHYVANIDSTDFHDVISKVDIEETLFLVQSKSFGTIETACNAQAARSFLVDHGLSDLDLSKHLYSVTSNIEAAKKFGVLDENIFPMWDWVGGRYSLWSAIGLPIAFLVGSDNFEKLLKGAYDMDQHFLNADIHSNIPALMGLIGIWYHNFFDVATHAVLPYSHHLRLLSSHLQQVDMESNGKQVTWSGERVKSHTGPVVWGAEGTNGQHAYHQLLHQGTHIIPCDFLIPMRSTFPIGNHQAILVANCFSQSKALMEGKTHDQALAELLAEGRSKEEAEALAPHKVYEGNRPSNTLVFDILSPETTGALIAAYEHKVFVQGVVWGINSFDQWGVELGKVLGNDIFERLVAESTVAELDSSSNGLIDLFRRANPPKQD